MTPIEAFTSMSNTIQNDAYDRVVKTAPTPFFDLVRTLLYSVENRNRTGGSWMLDQDAKAVRDVMPPPVPERPMPEPDPRGDIIEFLLGAAPFDGLWYGDKHPTEKGSWWWRRHLREYVAALKASVPEQSIPKPGWPDMNPNVWAAPIGEDVLVLWGDGFEVARLNEIATAFYTPDDKCIPPDELTGWWPLPSKEPVSSQIIPTPIDEEAAFRRAAAKLWSIGRHHGWFKYPNIPEKFDQMDPIGVDEFLGCVAEIVRAAYPSPVTEGADP